MQFQCNTWISIHMLTHAKQITTFSSLLRQASSSHATCPIRSPEMLLQRHFVQLSKTQRENISNPILYGASGTFHTYIMSTSATFWYFLRSFVSQRRSWSLKTFLDLVWSLSFCLSDSSSCFLQNKREINK